MTQPAAFPVCSTIPYGFKCKHICHVHCCHRHRWPLLVPVLLLIVVVLECTGR